MILSDDAQRMLGRFHIEEWETFGLKVAETIRGRTDVDPVLRMILLTRTMTILSKCAWGIDEEVRNIQRTLSAHDTEDVNWMNPDDDNASRVRERINTTLTRLGALEALGVNVRQQRREKIEEPLLFKCVLFGVALRDRDNKWQVMTARPLTPQMNGCKAVVVSGDKLRKIAEVRDGKVAVVQDNMNGVLQGTMVFICR